jgi:hypothetical protein
MKLRQQISDPEMIWRGRAEDALVTRSLSSDHRDALGAGCTFASFGSELARADRGICGAATRALSKQVVVLEALVPGRTTSDRCRKARAAYAGLVGGWCRLSITLSQGHELKRCIGECDAAGLNQSAERPTAGG